jgi:hypothetical protein
MGSSSSEQSIPSVPAPRTSPGASPSVGGSEFELTLAPEDEGPRTNPLQLGDDEDVELGAMPPQDGTGSKSNRAELSGINLQVPADSGISLEKGKGGADSDAVDFELTLDEEASGPKTLRGKLTDSDSEFELTLDEGGSSSSMKKKKSVVDASGEQKDIFETDFDLQAAGMGEEESGSQAVAIDEADTDLESSDFDLAIEEDASGSEVVPLPEDETASLEEGAPRPKSKVSKVDSSLGEVDSYPDEDLLPSEEAPAQEGLEEEPAAMSVPAAQADWGLYPMLMMIPCVLIMILSGLMAYELVHNMWGYHQTSKPTGLLVESFANMFKDEKAQ